MRKIPVILVVILVLTSICILGFGYKKSALPNHFYRVYMDGKVVGTIKSKDALEKYIDDNGTYYKKKYNVDKIYAPTGLQIKEFVTYDNSTDSIRKVYSKIKQQSNFAVKGYVM
ncbi:MAG: hypothetical protein IJ093_02060, partial [Bacilli bacterium]|nr:hypothetical protein [Bacilli bacterium]